MYNIAKFIISVLYLYAHPQHAIMIILFNKIVF